jgi:preprotein translocase subunit SecE
MGKASLATAKPHEGLSGLLLGTALYKRNQGKITRQVTFLVVALVFCLAAMRMFNYWTSFPSWWQRIFAGDVFRYGLTIAFGVAGVWFAFRLVNYPRFADFLIAVEAEMNKVSWPSRTELVRSAIVVMVVIAILVVVLFSFDFLLRLILGDWLRIIGA